MTDWNKTRDGLYLSLHRHTFTCPYCQGDATGVRIHNTCDTGILLLTEWYTAKCHSDRTPIFKPTTTTTEATP